MATRSASGSRCSPASPRSGGAPTGGSSCGRRWSGRRPLVAITGTAALLLTGIGSTAYDGAKEGPLFTDLLREFQDVRTRGLDRARARARLVLGLAIALAVVAAIWSAAVRGMPLEGLRLRAASSRAASRTR